ncbi:MAG TPA: pirin family protein [Burkholderiaceae bacterium]|jgi:redox-sensitive bicupin YhaK (pirin superfamily)|nr:pirin family protein [Burkholderiaceae bacterium]
MLQLSSHDKDLGGGFLVRRLLPALQQRAVGPFVFFDHFGPIAAGPDDDHDVRPHPHIGLATVTYLFAGAQVHRDSTGVVQRIEPGAINWMTAGRGIVHSERTPDELRGHERVSHGLQLWAALPAEDEELEPSFSHTPAAAIPELRQPGATLRVLIGSAFGVASPVPTRSPTLYLDLALEAGAEVELPGELATERALYGVDELVTVDGEPVPPHRMAVLDAGRSVRLRSEQAARVVLIGGEPLGPRYMWWNFVSSRKERIVQAADDWAAQPNGAFPQVPGERDFIPLPEKRPTV